MYIAVFAISVLIGCGVSIFILALFNADAPTREDYNALKLECESWHRLAVKYHDENFLSLMTVTGWMMRKPP